MLKNQLGGTELPTQKYFVVYYLEIIRISIFIVVDLNQPQKLYHVPLVVVFTLYICFFYIQISLFIPI